MSLIQFVCYILGVLAFFHLGQSYMTVFPPGRRLFDLFESGIINVINWRANADVQQEITTIKEFFRKVSNNSWLTALFIIVALSFLKLEFLTDILEFIFIVSGLSFIISGIVWISLELTFNNIGKHLKEIFIFVSLPIGGLFFIGLIETFGYVSEGSLARTNPPFLEYSQYLGLNISSPLVIALWGSSRFLGSFLFIYIMNLLALSPIRFSIFFALYSSHRFASFAVERTNRDIVNLIVFLIALAVTIVQPLL